MKSFKTFLTEYLTDYQRKKYNSFRIDDSVRKATDHFFGKDNDEIEGEIDHQMTDKSEIHKKVEHHLGREISHDQYRSGLIKDKYNRDVKIGRMIKDPKLRDEFARDPVREGSRSQFHQYTTRTVRGIEVAGQTNSEPNEQHPKGHSWGKLSCKNVDDGINKHYLVKEIKRGTVVHFVRDHNGQEIYRATLQPHFNNRGDVAYAIDSEYGIKHPSFTKSANDVAARLSEKSPTVSIYRKDPEVYHDSDQSYMVPPAASAEDLHTLLYHVDRTSDGMAHRINSVVLDHPNSDETHIQTVLDKSLEIAPSLANKITQHPKTTSSILNDAIDKHGLFSAAARSPKLEPHHITKILNNGSVSAVRALMSNPHTPIKHIIRGTEHPEWSIRRAAYGNPNLPIDHFNKGLNDPDIGVRMEVVSNGRTKDPEVLHRALDHENYMMRRSVFENPNADHTHIQRALDDPSWNVRLLAATHKNTTSDQLHNFLYDEDKYVRRSALRSPNMTADHWDAVYHHPFDSVMHSMAARELNRPETR